MSNPVTIDPNTTYVASYYAPSGHYTATAGYFYPSPAPTPVGGAETNSPPLKAVPNTGAIVDGVYSYSAASTFPSSTYNATNYWVDVLFAPTVVGPPGQVTGVSATAGQNSATVTWSAPSSGGTPTSYTVTPFIGSTAQTPMSVTGSATSATVTGLTAGTAYTFTVQASNSSGSGPVSAPSNSVTPTAATAPGAPTGVSAGPASSQALLSWTAPGSDGGSPITGYTVTPYIGTSAQAPLQVNSGSATSAIVTGLTNGTSYTFTVSATNSVGTGAASAASSATTPQDTIFDFSTPSTLDSGDSSSVELGVKFTASVTGSVTGIRFYKGSSSNGGTHIGSLWSASGGPPLTTATFSNETTSGWQTVTFSSPVPITAGSTYVAGYFDPDGHYSDTSSGFSSAVTNGPLQAVANSTSANGMYAYSSSSTFPTNSFQATNYWVDVLFAPTS